MILDAEHKKCRICGEIKNIDEFHKKKKSSLGCRNECKECVKILQKKYKENPNFTKKNSEYLKEWRKNNKNYSKLPKRKEYRKNWIEQNKEKISKQSREYTKNNRERLYDIDRPKRKLRRLNKLKEDPLFKVTESVRNLIKNSIRYKGFKKNTKTEKILGCSFGFFKNYLEERFESWMNWENYGKYNGDLNYGWDIDHIIPISSALTEEEMMKLNHYTNLNPLCSLVNRHIKRNKII